MKNQDEISMAVSELVCTKKGIFDEYTLKEMIAFGYEVGYGEGMKEGKAQAKEEHVRVGMSKRMILADNKQWCSKKPTMVEK